MASGSPVADRHMGHLLALGLACGQGIMAFVTDAHTGRDRPDFGLDAPLIVYGYTALGAVGLVLLVLAAFSVGSSVLPGWGIWAFVLGFGVAALMVYSSKAGKLRVRDRLLDQLALRGDEDVLDLGCGSGLMLLGAATVYRRALAPVSTCGTPGTRLAQTASSA